MANATEASLLPGEARAFSELAREILRMVDNREAESALASAHRLIQVSPTEAHRIVAGDLEAALASNDHDCARRIAVTAGRQPDLRSAKVISRRYEYLWISIPKVASRSIRYALLDMDPGAELIQQKTIAQVYELCPESRSYYSFAFVRHPFRRTLSFDREVFFSHSFAKTHPRYQEKERCFFDPATGRLRSLVSYREVASPLPKQEKRRQLFDFYHGLEEASSFDDVCQWLNTPYGSDAFAERHLLSQHLQVDLGNGHLPDFVGRFENLEEDWRRIVADLGMPATSLSLLNTMAGRLPTSRALKDAREAAEVDLTEGNKALLRTRYAGDFELFGY